MRPAARILQAPPHHVGGYYSPPDKILLLLVGLIPIIVDDEIRNCFVELCKKRLGVEGKGLLPGYACASQAKSVQVQACVRVCKAGAMRTELALNCKMTLSCNFDDLSAQALGVGAVKCNSKPVVF